MGYFEHRSDIDIEIANCYSQIEALQNKIKTLKAQKEKEESMDRLVRQLNEKSKDE